MATRADVEQAAAALRALLDAVRVGELTAETPAERRMVARIEGAVLGLEAAPGSGHRR